MVNSISMDNMNGSQIHKYIEQLSDWLVAKCCDILVAFIFLFIGIKISKLLIKFLKKSFEKSGIESSVSGFLISLIKGLLYIVVFIMAATIMGFQVTSLITILGTAGLAIGLALQGSLANFAGGVLILIMKPFKVGDYIVDNSLNCEGTVISIDIFYTKLMTADRRVVVIPNGNITANAITNVTPEEERVIMTTISVAYDSEIDKVRSVIDSVIKELDDSLKDKDIDIYVDSLGEYCINVGVKFYVKSINYIKTKRLFNEKILSAFRKENIVIPFRTIDIFVNNKN